jgi:hypothetical protein
LNYLILNKFYLNHKIQMDNQFLIKYNFENLINYLLVLIPELINFCFIHLGTVKSVKFSTVIAINVEQFCSFEIIEDKFSIFVSNLNF